MKVSELFSALSVGELNGLSLSLGGSGDIDENQKSKIIYYANQTLTQLYTRFPHKTSYVKIELQEDLHDYFLQPQFAVSNTDVADTSPRYIQDTVENPIDPRIGKILSILDEDAECYRDREVLLNDPSRDVAVKMIAHDGFFVRYPVAGNIYLVEVQSLHPMLNAETPDDDEVISLAPVLHEALTSRIAAKVYKAMGNADATAKGAEFMALYNELCDRIELDDTLQKTASNDHDKLREGGWE